MTTLILTDKQFAAIRATISIAAKYLDDDIGKTVEEGFPCMAGLYATRRVIVERAASVAYGTPFPEDGGAE